MTDEQATKHLKLAREANAAGNYAEAERIANEVLAWLQNPTQTHSEKEGFEESSSSSFPFGEGRDGVFGEGRDGVFVEGRDGVLLHSDALLVLADSARLQGALAQAQTLAGAALALAEEYDYPSIKAKCSNTLGIVYLNLGSYDMALEYFDRALAVNKELEDKSGVAIVNGNIGTVYRNLGSYDKALEYCGRALALHEELGEKTCVAIVNGNIGNVYSNLGSYDKALEYYGTALAVHEELGEKSGAARVTGNIGIVYEKLGTYGTALEYYGKALALHEELDEKSGVAADTMNIGNVYAHLVSCDKSLEYYGKALALYEELGAKSGVALVTGNIGIVYMELGSYDKSLEYFGKALVQHEELGEKSNVALVIGNIGGVYYSLGSYDTALEYYGKALALHEELGTKSGVARVTGNFGELYAKQDFDGYDAAKAEEYLLKAVAINENIGAKHNLYKNHKQLAELFEKQKRWEEAYLHKSKYHELEKEVQSEEATKQAALMEQHKQIAEREKGLAIERATHEATEQLLHNVLPPSIAHRMIQGENVIAEKLDHVSVLFADIVNFTNLSQRITAEELVAGLDRIFSEFDALAEKYGLEKIKTIGDAYMVVSGAPVPRADHAEAMAQFAIEILESMKQFTSISTGEEIQIRIGIHSGEVVAGVIGKKKFAYDLWGDAVNTAARMESHGEAGKIHCTEEFVRNLTPAISAGEGADSFSFPFGEDRDGVLGEGRDGVLRVVPRGEMEIKGKGLMKTFFLEKA